MSESKNSLWTRNQLERFKVSGERAETIFQDINQGSTPAGGYYALISAAALIASLGLVANSAAVVIGAMLVSPLMTPIFGMALGMIRGEPALLGRAVRAEVTGAVLAVAFGALFGFFPIMIDVTPEMLSRTQPTLLDLLVAVFAGLAGALAMLDERISPALPGVAISTAIVPPLATCGLCLALGAFDGAYGAFLLFFANFVAILLVASLAFLLSGMGLEGETHMRQLKKRMFIAVLGFMLVSAYLTHALILMIEDRQESRTIDRVMAEVMAKDPNSSVVSVHYKEFDDNFNILATIRTPKSFTPDQVRNIEDRLQKALDRQIRLVIRCVLSRDISPTGSTSVVINPTLDGRFISDDVPPDVKRLQLAEQTLREIFAEKPQLLLLDVDLAHILGDPVILASIQSSRPMVPLEVKQMEEAIQKRLEDPTIRLLARSQVAVDVASNGRILYGSAHFGPQPDDAAKITARAAKAIEDSGEFFVTAMDAVKRGDVWEARAEVSGTRIMTSKEVAEIEKSLAGWLAEKVKLLVWSRTDLMVQSNRAMPVEEFTRRRLLDARSKAQKADDDARPDPIEQAAPIPEAPN
jgi:uncharacterized hydrophobic protein (TIGR00271 family)